MVTDRILDLCILIAKFFFISRLYGTVLHLNGFTRFLKNRGVLEKYYYVKWQTKQIPCRLDTAQLTPFMNSSLLSGVFCFYSALLFSISIAN